MLCQLILDFKKKTTRFLNIRSIFFCLSLLLLRWLFKTGCYGTQAGLKFTLTAKTNPLPPLSDSQDVEAATWVFLCSSLLNTRMHRHNPPSCHSTRLRTQKMPKKEVFIAWMNSLKDCSFQQLWPNKLYWFCLLKGKATPRPPQMGKLPKHRYRAALALFGCLPGSGFNNLACSFIAWTTRLSATVWVLCPHTGARCWENWLWGLWKPCKQEGGVCTPGCEAREVVCKRNPV